LFVRSIARSDRRGIADEMLGDWLRTCQPGEAGIDRTEVVTEVAVGLVQEESDGSRLEVELLRAREWLSDTGVSLVGESVTLDLPEMGVGGEFQIVGIGSAVTRTLQRRVGWGRVTGRFRFSRGWTLNLFVAGESKPIGVTRQHPFWSVDRETWVPVRELEIGERLQVAGGTRQVLGIEPRGAEPVFNLEVDADHCYRVGEQGILVHNASLDPLNMIGRRQGLQYVDSVRDRLDVETTRNIAYLEYSIGETEGRLTAISGEGAYADTVGVPANPVFQAFDVGHARDADSEYKLLNALAALLGDKPCDKVRVRLFTERPLCPSCQGVVAQFKARYAGADVKIVTSDGSRK
jgi:hypothetical protein